MSKQTVTILGTNRTRDVNRDMYDYMPTDYREINESSAIVDAESKEVKQVYDEISDVLDQFFIDKATWGLSQWERICDIPTDETKPYDQRRSVIKSQIRGIGTVTSELIKNVSDSYTNGEVNVSEDNVNYTVIITFTSIFGRPPNIDDTKKALRDIIPAHLGIDFQFRYYTIDEVDAMTIDGIQAELLENFAPFNEDKYDV